MDLTGCNGFSHRLTQVLREKVKEDRVVVRSDIERLSEGDFCRRVVLLYESFIEFL